MFACDMPDTQTVYVCTPSGWGVGVRVSEHMYVVCDTTICMLVFDDTKCCSWFHLHINL